MEKIFVTVDDEKIERDSEKNKGAEGQISFFD